MNGYPLLVGHKKENLMLSKTFMTNITQDGWASPVFEDLHRKGQNVELLHDDKRFNFDESFTAWLLTECTFNQSWVWGLLILWTFFNCRNPHFPLPEEGKIGPLYCTTTDIKLTQ